MREGITIRIGLSMDLAFMEDDPHLNQAPRIYKSGRNRATKLANKVSSTKSVNLEYRTTTTINNSCRQQMTDLMNRRENK